MFSRVSRYRKLNDELAVDAHGRSALYRAIRPFEPVEGRVRHTLEQGERLDQLAYRYYRASRDWWRICDANAAYQSPQALVGADHSVSATLDLQREGEMPYWGTVITALRALPGMLAARLGTAAMDHPQGTLEYADPTFDLDEGLEPLLEEAVLTQTLAPSLGAELAAVGVEGIDRVDKPAADEWLMSNELTLDRWSLQRREGSIHGRGAFMRYAWQAEVTIDGDRHVIGDVVAALESTGLELQAPTIVDRVGKRIRIPARQVR